MESEMDSNVAPMPSGKIPQYHSKVMLVCKRGSEYLDQDSDSSNKRPKMRDLLSVLQCEGINNHDPATSKIEESEEHMVVVETQCSQIFDNNAVEYADARILKEYLQIHQHYGLIMLVLTLLDLNNELCTDEYSGYNYTIEPIQDAGRNSSSVTQKSSGGAQLNLNVEDVASSAIQDPFYETKPYNNNKKTRFSLECGRSAGHSDDKEALRRWKEMKQNGFVSLSYGGIPTAPKQRGRKSKNDVLKQKMKQAKKEQVDRFAKIAAPCGLLNGLNPGIINHVRNSKQVRSIIQTLVKSEKMEGHTQASELKAARKEPMSFSCHEKPYFASQPKNNCEDDLLALKLSSSTMVSESTSCLSSEESKIVNSVDILSVKAANVASQWLQLELQDIKGRLDALHCSKKRVHAVISTELPFLLSKELHSNQDSAMGCLSSVTTELHRAKWTRLFTQMESALSEEEKQLEHWLKQVKQMQIHCDQGLQHVLLNTIFDNQLRSKVNDPEKDLSVRAAAASIYSTCNFQSSKENVVYC